MRINRGPSGYSPCPYGTGKLSFTARLLPVPTSFSWVAWLILECARRTSTFLSCALREQEDDQATHLSHSPKDFTEDGIAPIQAMAVLSKISCTACQGT